MLSKRLMWKIGCKSGEKIFKGRSLVDRCILTFPQLPVLIFLHFLENMIDLDPSDPQFPLPFPVRQLDGSPRSLLLMDGAPSVAVNVLF